MYDNKVHLQTPNVKNLVIELIRMEKHHFEMTTPTNYHPTFSIKASAKQSTRWHVINQPAN